MKESYEKHVAWKRRREILLFFYASSLLGSSGQVSEGSAFELDLKVSPQMKKVMHSEELLKQIVKAM
jgi:hypothetical protein